MWSARLPHPKSSQPVAPGAFLQSGTMARLLLSSTASSSSISHSSSPTIPVFVPSHVSIVRGKVTGSTPHPALAGHTPDGVPTTAVAFAFVVMVPKPTARMRNVSKSSVLDPLTPWLPAGMPAPDPHTGAEADDGAVEVRELGLLEVDLVCVCRGLDGAPHVAGGRRCCRVAEIVLDDRGTSHGNPVGRVLRAALLSQGMTTIDDRPEPWR